MGPAPTRPRSLDVVRRSRLKSARTRVHAIPQIMQNPLAVSRLTVLGEWTVNSGMFTASGRRFGPTRVPPALGHIALKSRWAAQLAQARVPIYKVPAEVIQTGIVR
jgi:hypothetical protein